MAGDDDDVAIVAPAPEGGGGGDDAQVPSQASLPHHVLVGQVLPYLRAGSARSYRASSRELNEQVTAAVTSLTRRPGTAWLPGSLAKFSNLRSLTLSYCEDVTGGVELYNSLTSLSALTSLALADCTDLSAGFVIRQLHQAVPGLRSLTLTCACTSPPNDESAVLASLTRLPHLTHLCLVGSQRFQPPLTALPYMLRLRSLEVLRSKALCDEHLPALRALAPSLECLTLDEQQGRRSGHLRGHGLTALSALRLMHTLTLGCPELDLRRGLPAVAQLTSLDLSKSGAAAEHGLGRSLALLTSLQALQHLALPASYNTDDDIAGGTAQLLHAATRLRRLTVHAPTGLTGELLDAVQELSALECLDYTQHTADPPDVAAAAAATALGQLTALTAVRLALWYSSEEGEQGPGLAAEQDAPSAEPYVRIYTQKQQHGPALPPQLLGAVDGLGALSLQEKGGDARTGEGEGDAPEPTSPPSPRGGSRPCPWLLAAPRWSQLLSLSLSGGPGADDHQLSELSALTRLTAVSLASLPSQVTGSGLRTWSACRAMISLSLHECPGWSSAGCAALAAALPSLKSLQLRYLPTVTASGIAALARLSPSLNQLTLERLGGVDPEGLATLSALSRLEVLSLNACNLTDAAAREALAGMPHLDSLDVSATLVGPEGLLAAVACVPGLTSLSLRSCLNVTDAAALALPRLCPGLVFLEVVGCPSVRQPAIEELRRRGLAVNTQ